MADLIPDEAVALALAAGGIAGEPGETVRDQMTRAMGAVGGHLYDRYVAPIVAERDEARRDALHIRSEYAYVAWLHAEAAWQRDVLSSMLRGMARKVGDVRQDWLNRVRLNWHCKSPDCHRGHERDYEPDGYRCVDCSTEDREVRWSQCDLIQPGRPFDLNDWGTRMIVGEAVRDWVNEDDGPEGIEWQDAAGGEDDR